MKNRKYTFWQKFDYSYILWYDIIRKKIMEKDIDRIGFYEKLSECKTRLEIENLMDEIDNDDLHYAALDKYNQIMEFNKNKNDGNLVKDIIKILEYTYLNFYK